MVYKYIQKIPVDRFTRLTPVWELQEVREGGEDRFVVTCHMPHKTPFQR